MKPQVLKTITMVFILIMLVALAINTACKDNDSNGNMYIPFVTNGLTGTIKDTEGNAIEGVTVTGGNNTSTSNSDGTFSIPMVAGSDQTVLFNREGYVETLKIVDIIEGETTDITVILAIQELAGRLDAGTGGTVKGSRNASLTAGPGAFVDSSGDVVSGEVDVYITPLDPTKQQEANAYPGVLKGKNKDGEEVILQSYGIMDVTVKKDGEKLQVTPGKTVNIQIPLPSGTGARPDTINMWYFDMESGFWIQHDNDGTYDALTNTYAAGISHFSFENSDNPFTPSCIYGKVVDSEGNGIEGAYITAQQYGDDDNGRGVYSWMYTNRDGNYCMTVEWDTTVLLTAEYEDTITTRIITAGSERCFSYPADCGEDSCKHIRPIENGTPDPGELLEADCEIDWMDNNPFSGTCAMNLVRFYECFSPEGACSYVIDPGFLGGIPTYEMEFANGARVESDYNMITGAIEFEHYGPTGTLCGTMTYDEDTGGTKIILENGDEYIIKTTEDGGVEIECPVGSFLVNTEQEIALMGCTAQAGDDSSGVECEAEEGSFMAPCDFTSDCQDGYECCGDFMDDQLCMPSSMCSAYEDSCSTNLDCAEFGHDWVCCNNGFFKSCMPYDACAELE
ncbi:MAG: carboxypeptidase-like regulatory domain-containing protein [Spirochaetota bacterium]|nr:carboxypeptidase-like regulatory domain-containing protein [Spirochaetota bacterium]